MLAASDRDVLLDWLRQQSLALPLDVAGHPMLLVHAGVLPSWSRTHTLALAAEVQDALRGADYGEFLHAMYGNAPTQWSEDLQGAQRLRAVVNALTRMRFCDAQGVMEFKTSGGVDHAPPGFMPWFEVPGRATANDTVVFGHWSALGGLMRENLMALDTGCVWGGCLSALRLDPQQAPGALAWTLHQVHCEAAQTPGLQ